MHRVPSKRCQAVKKGRLGDGEGGCQSCREKEQRAEQEKWVKLKCKWTRALLAKAAAEKTQKGCRGESIGSEELGS